MQLKRLHLENFQCIAGPTTIEFAPLTLLYGRNSSGKSAIGDALELLAQVLSSRADPSLIARWTRAKSYPMRVGIGFEMRADQLWSYIEGAGIAKSIGPNPAGALDIDDDKAYLALCRMMNPESHGKSGTTEVDVMFDIAIHDGLLNVWLY